MGNLMRICVVHVCMLCVKFQKLQEIIRQKKHMHCVSWMLASSLTFSQNLFWFVNEHQKAADGRDVDTESLNLTTAQPNTKNVYGITFAPHIYFRTELLIVINETSKRLQSITFYITYGVVNRYTQITSVAFSTWKHHPECRDPWASFIHVWE